MGSSCKRVSYSELLPIDARLTIVSELTVKVVNTRDMTKIVYLRDQPRAVKHVSWDPSGKILSASCSDGAIYVYSFESDGVSLLKKISNVVKSAETDEEASIKAYWHPDGRAFGAASLTRGKLQGYFPHASF